MNPHNHPPKINSVAMDQLPTPRTEAAKYDAYDGFEGARPHYVVEPDDMAKVERELLASQARECVLRSALEELAIMASDCIGLDEDNTPACSSCGMELGDDGEGHSASCLANNILSYTYLLRNHP